MTATELRALERLEADAHYLARLIERTMVVDAVEANNRHLLMQVRRVQSLLRVIENETRDVQAVPTVLEDCGVSAQEVIT